MRVVQSSLTSPDRSYSLAEVKGTCKLRRKKSARWRITFSMSGRQQTLLRSVVGFSKTTQRSIALCVQTL